MCAHLLWKSAPGVKKIALKFHLSSVSVQAPPHYHPGATLLLKKIFKDQTGEEASSKSSSLRKTFQV